MAAFEVPNRGVPVDLIPKVPVELLGISLIELGGIRKMIVPTGGRCIRFFWLLLCSLSVSLGGRGRCVALRLLRSDQLLCIDFGLGRRAKVLYLFGPPVPILPNRIVCAALLTEISQNFCELPLRYSSLCFMAYLPSYFYQGYCTRAICVERHVCLTVRHSYQVVCVTWIRLA